MSNDQPYRIPKEWEEFEKDGELVVKEHIARDYYGEVKLRLAKDWLDLKDRQRAKAREAEQAEEAVRARNAAERAAEAAERAADAAEEQSNQAQRANRIALTALLMAIAATIMSHIALARKIS